MVRSFLSACALFSIAIQGGCANGVPSSSEKQPDKQYDLKGKVVSVDAAAKSVKIDHEEITGLMKAMTMSFSVEDPKVLDGLAAGDRVEGKLKVVDKKYVLSELHKPKTAAAAPAPSGREQPRLLELPAAPPAKADVAVKTEAADLESKIAKADEDAEEKAKIKMNLGKLSEADRKLAEKQKFCPIEDDTLLGATGVPIKLTVKGQPVFICCKGCKEAVEKDPDAALKKVAELVKKNKK